MIKHNCQINNNEEGFSIIEILVAILVLVAFMLGTLQAMVFAALVIVKSEEKTQVLNWIQQDVERVQYEAFLLDKTEPNGYNPTRCDNSTYGQALSTALPGTYPATIIIPQESSPNPNEIHPIYRVYRVLTPTSNTLNIQYTVAYAPADSPTFLKPHPRYNSSDSYNLTTPPTDSNSNFIATLSTTEIPNASFKCP